MTKLQEEIREFIMATFPMARKRKITPEESLLETGIIDSLGVLEIVAYLDDQLGVQFEEEDLTQDNFQNVNAIVQFVERKRSLARSNG